MSMNFSKWDIGIIVSMSIAVISMSFVFPAMGLTGENVNESEIPEFNISADRFDWTGDFPENPGTPSQGVLWWDSTLKGDSKNVIWLHGDTQSGVEMVFRNTGNESHPEGKYIITKWDNGNATSNDYFFTEEGHIETHENFSYQVRLEAIKFDTELENNQSYMEIQFNVEEQTSDNSWYDRIPVLGTVAGAGSQLAGMLGWVGTVIWWISATLFTTVLNMLGITFDVVTFMVSMFAWLVTTYLDIITGAPSWASVFLSIPGILLSVELGKIIMVVISLLPTT